MWLDLGLINIFLIKINPITKPVWNDSSPVLASLVTVEYDLFSLAITDYLR